MRRSQSGARPRVGQIECTATCPMQGNNVTPGVLRNLASDGWLLFVTRFIRLYAYVRVVVGHPRFLSRELGTQRVANGRASEPDACG